MKKPIYIIMKMQVSISGEPQTMMYDKRHGHLTFMPREFGEKHLGEDLKGFFKVMVRGDRTLRVLKRVEDREW